MDDLLIAFGAAAVLAAALANIGLWSPRRRWVKVGALALAALFLPTSYFAMASLLSRPKPIALEWSPPEPQETTVIAAQMQEPEAIYLWISRPDSTEPRAYVMPWDESLARELHEAQRSAEADGGTVQVRLMRKTQDSDPAEKTFYSAPPPPPPPKVVGSQGGDAPLASLAGAESE